MNQNPELKDRGYKKEYSEILKKNIYYIPTPVSKPTKKKPKSKGDKK
jgi:hypothetical protein